MGTNTLILIFESLLEVTTTIKNVKTYRRKVKRGSQRIFMKWLTLYLKMDTAFYHGDKRTKCINCVLYLQGFALELPPITEASSCTILVTLCLSTQQWMGIWSKAEGKMRQRKQPATLPQNALVQDGTSLTRYFQTLGSGMGLNYA